MNNFHLPQESRGKVVLTLENPCNLVHLLNIMMICTEAEKASDEIQHPVKINISKRPKKYQVFYLMVNH